MTTREKINKIVKNNPNLSGREVGKILGITRSTANYHINKLGFYRDREKLRKLNNTNRSFPINISKKVHQFILGSLLGDGHISKYNKHKNSSKSLNSYLSFKHSLLQEEYSLFKRDLLINEDI